MGRIESEQQRTQSDQVQNAAKLNQEQWQAQSKHEQNPAELKQERIKQNRNKNRSELNCYRNRSSRIEAWQEASRIAARIDQAESQQESIKQNQPKNRSIDKFKKRAKRDANKTVEADDSPEAMPSKKAIKRAESAARTRRAAIKQSLTSYPS